MRKIHIGETVWEYVFGKENVVIKSPTNVKSVVDYSTLTGIPWFAIEDGRKDGYSYGMIKPSHVKSYIENNLLENES